MLKSKSTIYILIPVNILIWGFFIYRFYTAYTEGDSQIEEKKIQVVKLDELEDSSNYRLSLNYKDPFLREVYKMKNQERKSVKTSNRNIQAAGIIKTPTVAIPKAVNDIKYMGLIKNNNTGVSTALISINGNSHLVKKGDVISGIIIKGISNETIELKEGKKSIVISKN